MTGSRTLRLGIITALVVYGFTLLVFLRVPSRIFAPAGTDIAAQFAYSGDLVKGDPVRVNGVKAGEVKDIDLIHGGRATRITLKVWDDATPVYADARAAIRWRTVLGGNEYVELDRGSARAGKLSGAIPLRRTETQTELDDITTTLRGKAGPGLQSTLREVARTLRSPGTVRSTVGVVGEQAPTIAKGIAPLRGERNGDLRALVQAVGDTTSALDGSSEPVRHLLQGAAATLAVTARRSAELEQTLQRAPVTMRDIDVTLRAVDATLDGADPLVARLDKSVGDVAPTLRKARPLLVSADRLLEDISPLLARLRPAVRMLAVTAQRGGPLAADLLPDLERIDEQILPNLAERDPITRRAGYEMIGPTLSAASDATGLFDSEGRYLRFPALSAGNPLDAAPCRVMVADPEAAGQIANCEGVLSAFNELLKVPGK